MTRSAHMVPPSPGLATKARTGPRGNVAKGNRTASGDATRIRDNLARMLAPDCVYELRALGAPRAGTVSGYFDNLDALAAAAAEWSGRASGVYVSLNPCRAELLSRAVNRATPFAKHTTGDAEITRRARLFFDFDPSRPAGIASTDGEHAAALDRARAARDVLKAAEWPEPLLVDSGNGAYLVYAVDLPNDDDAKSLTKRVLEAAAGQWSDAAVTVDEGVFNAARICRIPGTMNRKGDHTEERPHRLAVSLEGPEQLEVVPRELLGAFAARLPDSPEAPARTTKERSAERFDIDGLVERAGLAVVSETPYGQGGRRLRLAECPFDPSHTKGSAALFLSGSGAPGFKCQHTGCRSVGMKWRAVREAIDPEAPSTGVAHAVVEQYHDEPGFLVWDRPTRDGTTPTALANFTARIDAEVVRDDGTDPTTMFRVSGRLSSGRPLPSIDVRASNFDAMAWPTAEWGARPVVYAGMGTRDHARAAIRILSGDSIAQETRYIHLGWREVDGRPVYLHADGALGANGPVEGICVEPEGALARYRLPAPPATPEETGVALRASLRLLDVAPDVVTVPLLAAVYRPVVGAANFFVHVTGQTNARKTSASMIAQAHYGDGMWSKDDAPASWSSTGNSLEGLSHLAKDALLLIDEFVPRHDIDARKLQATAERVLRAQGNRSGRGRMRADGTLRPDKPPRGLILSTGEETMAGASLRARGLILDLRAGDVDLAVLSELQTAGREGVLARALAGFISWLAPQLSEAQREVADAEAAWRAQRYAHGRTAETLGSLAGALALVARFGRERAGLSAEEAEALMKRCIAALDEVGRAQAAHQRHEDPVTRFLELLNAALSSGRAHVASAEDGMAPLGHVPETWGWRLDDDRWREKGDRIGWIAGEDPDADLYLEPEAAYRVAQEIARGQGGALPTARERLQSILAERGLLVGHEEGRTTRRPMIVGQQRRVLHLRPETLIGSNA